MMDLAALIAAHMRSMPTPDRPPVSFTAGPARGKPTKVETRLVNGKWILVPVAYGPGREDKALRPRVTVTPIPRPPL